MQPHPECPGPLRRCGQSTTSTAASAVLQLPGINTADALGRPPRLVLRGSVQAAGFSDQLPILARSPPARASLPPDGELNNGEEAPDLEFHLLPPKSSSRTCPEALPRRSPRFRLAPIFGKLYEDRGRGDPGHPVFLQVGDSRWSAYSFNPEILEELRESAGRDSEVDP